MKNKLVYSVTILLLSNSGILADSIRLTNNTPLTAYFTMYNGNQVQGPLCVLPGEKVFKDLTNYTSMSAYVVGQLGKKYPCHIAKDIEQDMASNHFYNHVVAIEECKNDCDGKKYQVVKIPNIGQTNRVAESACVSDNSKTELFKKIVKETQNLIKKIIKNMKNKEKPSMQQDIEQVDAQMQEILTSKANSSSTGKIDILKNNIAKGWNSFKKNASCLNNPSCTAVEQAASSVAAVKIGAVLVSTLSILTAVTVGLSVKDSLSKNPAASDTTNNVTSSKASDRPKTKAKNWVSTGIYGEYEPKPL